MMPRRRCPVSIQSSASSVPLCFKGFRLCLFLFFLSVSAVRFAFPDLAVAELPLKMRLHYRPLAGDDAVDARVADVSVGQDLVAAQNAVKLRAQALNGAPAGMVEKMRAQFHADAIQGVKGVREQKQFALCVERSALHALAVPCAANLHSPVCFV